MTLVDQGGPARPRGPDFLGFGLGLREPHHADILTGQPPVDWFEIITEDYMVAGGTHWRMLERIRDRYPIVMHGVSLSVASITPFDDIYLTALEDLAARIAPRWISDHLAWTGVHGNTLHGLLPIPYTKECIDHVAARVHYVQDRLGRPLTLENVASPVRFADPDMSEGTFITELSRRTGCWLLLDLNNVYVNAFNHGEDPYAFIEAIPAGSVVQFHVAGHSHMGTHIIDTHDHPVCDAVWDLYAAALRRFGPISTMIERDDAIPPLEDMILELDQARRIAQGILGRAREPRP